jgi:hypothetical protein
VVPGAVIRARREELGQTLEEVARATRIPLAHLEAVEEDRLDRLPTGPYASAYNRALCAHLGLEPSSSEDSPPLPAAPPQGAPLWMVRAMAMTSVVALALVLGSLVWERVRASLPALPLGARPGQELVVVARRPTRLTVRVDGAPALDRAVKEGERLSFEGRDAIELDVRATSDVKLQWNGVTVVPQGRQDAPRTLRFVDDPAVQW